MKTINSHTARFGRIILYLEATPARRGTGVDRYGNLTTQDAGIYTAYGHPRGPGSHDDEGDWRPLTLSGSLGFWGLIGGLATALVWVVTNWIGA